MEKTGKTTYNDPPPHKKVKEDGTNTAFSTHGREEKCIQGFRRESQKETDHSEDLDVGERIILGWIFEK
jgi:hypothetical protein